MTDKEGADAALLFAFPDGSEAFVLGFEAGMIWSNIEDQGALVIDRGFESGFPIHTTNIEVVRRMATARGYEVECGSETVEGWTPVRLTWKGTGQTKPRLSLVGEG